MEGGVGGGGRGGGGAEQEGIREVSWQKQQERDREREREAFLFGTFQFNSFLPGICPHKHKTGFLVGGVVGVLWGSSARLLDELERLRRQPALSWLVLSGVAPSMYEVGWRDHSSRSLGFCTKLCKKHSHRFPRSYLLRELEGLGPWPLRDLLAVHHAVVVVLTSSTHRGPEWTPPQTPATHTCRMGILSLLFVLLLKPL